MRRLLIAGAAMTGLMVAMAVVAVYAIRLLVPPSPWRPGRIGAGQPGDAAAVTLDADRSVARVDAAAGDASAANGSMVSYAFRVRNRGTLPVRHLAVRSEMAPGHAAGHGDAPGRGAVRAPGHLRIVTISDTACWGHARVDCIFPALLPGETRAVTVQAAVEDAGADGRLVIRTFLGRFVPTPQGGVAYDVVGEPKETTGRIRHPTRR